LSITYEKFALFIGRIEEEKGILTLIKAFENTDYNLKIIGFSKSGYDKVMKEYLIGKKHNIEFLGKKDFNEIQPYLAGCSFTVVPSEWYDNLPNTMLESFAFKKCVVATNIGSLTELVNTGNTGFLFGLKDVQGLKKIIAKLFNDVSLCTVMGNNAYLKLKAEFSQEKHYETLMQLFNDTVSLY
jgi:glycosyltransferase involved in cell wall biosynthesis